jgi:hypothetical protein
MKQKIALTESNKKVLIEKYGMLLEELTIDYWQKVVVNSEEQMTFVFNKRSKKDIPSRIKTRANKLMMKRIEKVLGLPGKSGSIAKQKQWHKIFKASGLHYPI